MADVDPIIVKIQKLILWARGQFPGALVVAAQVEDRYIRGTNILHPLFKTFGNKYNNHLNKFKAKDTLLTLKGQRNFDRSLYVHDGVHLNREGNLRLCSKITNVITYLGQKAIEME